MTDHRQFLETVLDCQVATLKEAEIYLLANRIMQDPFIKARYDALYLPWWESAFKDLDLLNDDPGVPNVEVVWPDFYMQVAQELTRNDKLALRKKYTP